MKLCMAIHMAIIAVLSVVGGIMATPSPAVSQPASLHLYERDANYGYPTTINGQQCLLANPPNLAAGSLTVEEGCTAFTTAVSGDTCYGLLHVDYDPDLLSDFYMNNPAVGCGCYDLQIGTAYCVSDNLVY